MRERQVWGGGGGGGGGYIIYHIVLWGGVGSGKVVQLLLFILLGVGEETLLGEGTSSGVPPPLLHQT